MPSINRTTTNKFAVLWNHCKAYKIIIPNVYLLQLWLNTITVLKLLLYICLQMPKLFFPSTSPLLFLVITHILPKGLRLNLGYFFNRVLFLLLILFIPVAFAFSSVCLVQLLNLCEAEDAALMKLPCYKSLPSLVPLRIAALSKYSTSS